MDAHEPFAWPAVEALLDEVIELPPEARDTLLDAAAVRLPREVAEVRRMLAAAPRVRRFLERPARETAAALLAAGAVPMTPAPSRIGPYVVLREIGRGGMGTVYLGERADPELRQRVALKLVRGEAAAGTAVARFLDERRILASLEHPGIARLVDGGVTPDGLPWFAMEYVDGAAIDRWCAERNLPITERLRLFLDVCDAVQYAHTQLVVHCDLKPSNILVTGRGAVKLLDFGIARLMGDGTSALDRTGLPLATPACASPEQLRGERASTSSDVYALGVLLYLLLAGQHPHARGGRAPHEVARAVLEEEPPVPSQICAGARRRRVRGDLDTIALVALRREPERRYATVEQLASDVRLHLAGRPITARAHAWGYRTGRVLRRHPVGIAAAALIVLLTVAYVVTLTAHAQRIEREAARTAQVRDFLISLFAEANPGVSRGREPSASDLIDIGAERVAEDLVAHPDLQAEMMATLGLVYTTLGRYDDAVSQLRAAHAIREQLHPPASEAVAHTAQLLAEALHYRGDLEEAEMLARRVVETRRGLRGAESWRVGIDLNTLGDVLHTRGELDEAEVHLRRALAILLAIPDEAGAASARRDLANVLRDRRQWTEAESLYRQSLATLEARHGALDPMAALTRNELARLLAETGRHDEAELLLMHNTDVYEALYPRGHAIIGTTLRNIGVLRLRQGRYDDAAAALSQALDIYARTLPSGNALIPRARRHLAEAELRRGNDAEAERIAEDVIRTLHAIGLARHRALADAEAVLAEARATAR